MRLIIKNADIYLNGELKKTSMAIENGIILEISDNISERSDDIAVQGKKLCVFPGLIDPHVHMREPGFEYKETIKTATAACAHGGVTHACIMPNVNPVPDSPKKLCVSLEAVKKNSCIEVLPFGSVTVNEAGEVLSDMEGMSKYVSGFSDDGRGVQSAEMMKKAMLEAKRLGKVISAHCEVNSLLNGGYIHDGEYAKIHGHKGICSESEWKQVERDVSLAAETGVKYHVCHISTKESVEIIRNAKRAGIDVTCETAPHYLLYNDMDITENARFKMNPPIRGEADRLALVEGIVDGTIDMIATDHAPHSEEEKSRGLEKSLMGVSGIETSFSVMYTHFVKKNIISFERLMALMHDNAMKRFGMGGTLKTGEPCDLSIFDTEREFTVRGADFLSKGKCTPFEGKTMNGVCLLTFYDGKICYKDGSLNI